MSHIHALPAGTELVSDFRIERVLGAGGFGITYLATEIALDRQVTIKEYFPGDFAGRGHGISAVPRSGDCTPDYQWGLDRFIEEAQTLARFDHPNIVRVYRYFRANNTGYMVLHFEEGQRLKGWLQSLGRAPRQGELDRLVNPLLDALAVIHAADFLHRDIAPDNIIVRKDGSPVLIDFGAARGDIAQHSRTVSALVKPGYSPYEQYGEIGRQQGPWTDIYALAATLYHAICGKRPPDAPSRVMKDELRPAREAALSAYRAGFLAAIDQGLRIDIDKRPQTVAAWRAALCAPDASGEQRGWFGGRRQEPDLASTIDIAETRPITAPAQSPIRSPAHASATAMVPPPPDVPGRRGRIVDFLDGVRQSPREDATTMAAAVAPAGASIVAADQARLGAAAAQRRRGFFLRNLSPTPPPPAATAEIVPNDRAVDVRSAPNVAAKPEHREPQKRKPPKPRPVRRKSAWRWLPIAIKLAAGVVIATFLVRLQHSMPRFELRSGSTVASSPTETLRTVTGSTNRLATGTAKPMRSTEAEPTAPRSQSAKRKAADRERTASTATVAARVRNAPPIVASAAPLPPAPPSSNAEKPAPKPSATLLLRTFEAHAGGVSGVAFANAGRMIATVGGDATLKVWASESYRLIRTLELEYGPASTLAVRGNRALTGHESGQIALWNLDTGTQLKTFKRNDAPISSLAFVGEDRFVAGAHDWSVTLWETVTPSVPLHVFEGHGRDVMAVAYDPVRGLFASAGADRTVKLWEAKSLSHVRTYPRARNFVTAVAFSPDGDGLLIATLDGEISLYDTRDRKRRRRYRGHQARVTALTFIDGGREFVSASADGTVRLWNLREGRPMQTFGSAGATISSASVSPDGRLIVAGKDNGTVQFWNGAVLD